MKVLPGYLHLHETGKLREIINIVSEKYKSCDICPNKCRVNRYNSNKGICKTGYLPFVASYNAHFGEEPPLVGLFGSGTIFFSNCNLKCVFCQNFDISHNGTGHIISFEDLADIMISLQNRQCHNINVVTPSHQIYAILEALEIAIGKGLNIPLVYNSGGYDSSEILKLVNGVFDIFMPDIKYLDNESALKYSGINNYSETVKNAVYEMYNQVGDLQLNSSGIAKKGLIIRHLILPNNISDSKRIIDFVSDFSINTYINFMDQYRPEYKAASFPEIQRKIDENEFKEIIDYAKSKGLFRISK